VVAVRATSFKLLKLLMIQKFKNGKLRKDFNWRSKIESKLSLSLTTNQYSAL